MSAAQAIPAYSSEYQAINQWFHSTQPPYGFHDIYQFNNLYRQAYPRLSREERLRVEECVDRLIEGAETPKLAKRIFGVV
jgi:hypothetical protein